MSRLKVAVMLRPGADGTAAGTREQARYAEQLGLDGIFVGDHLKPAGPYPESMVVLAAAAAVTERIHVGVGVMVLASAIPRGPPSSSRHCNTSPAAASCSASALAASCMAPRHGRPSASPTPNVAAAPTRRS